MPFVWKASIAILVVCLSAAMAIGVVRLVETRTEILGLPAKEPQQSSGRR